MTITEKLTDKKSVNKYIILFMFTYLVSYLTRINFAAIIAKIEQAEGIPETILGLAVSGSSVFYGAGQLVSGYLGDKIQPKKLIGCGFILTTAINCLIPVAPSPYVMVVLWCFNGLIQAFMWPPLVRLMGSIFDSRDYSRACVFVSWGSSFGTIIMYLIAPAIIMISGWKYVFLFSAVCGIIMALFWWKSCPTIPPKPITPQTDTTEGGGSIKSIFSPLLIFILLAIALQGALRDGVTNWTPSYISKTFGIDAEFAILSTVILPIFSILCFYGASAIYRKKLDNPLSCAGLFFGIAFAATAILTLLYNTNMPLAVILAAILCGCMHGVNIMLVCMVPGHYEKYGKISFVSGLINSFTYVGSAISTFGVAAIAEKTNNWQLIIAIWAMIALLGTIIVLAFAKKYRKTMM
ncbi:MAG: MFS transporter [Clostridia bacterium]|nr:MFS transporter [Clostridia bacterium]